MITKKHIAINTALSVTVLIIFWLFLDFILFPPLLPKLPPKYLQYLPRETRILAQSSKKNLIPRHYIALFGDSNAAGVGDELLKVISNSGASFGIHHYLHQKTGIDIVNFAEGGSCNILGFVGIPIINLDYLKTTRYKVPDPDNIFLLFYEGNDLQGNLRTFNVFIAEGYDIQRIEDSNYFAAFCEKIMADYFGPPQIRGVSFLERNFIFSQFVVSLGRNLKSNLKSWIKPSKTKTQWATGETNQAKINGKIVPLPEYLQAPPVTLTEADMDLALKLLDHSLFMVARRFRAPITLVYIPSVLNVYQILSPWVSIQNEKSFYSPASVDQRGQMMRQKIETICFKHQIHFLDSSPTLREAAKSTLLHGPQDWRHFNKKGYELLAGFMEPSIKDEAI